MLYSATLFLFSASPHEIRFIFEQNPCLKEIENETVKQTHVYLTVFSTGVKKHKSTVEITENIK